MKKPNLSKPGIIAVIVIFGLTILSFCSFITILNGENVLEKLNIIQNSQEELSNGYKAKVEGKNIELSLEVARTREEQAKGLMDRTYLDPDSGMLFEFEDSQPRSFWMQNTYIPLDIAFLNEEGRVLNIERNAIPLDTGPRYRSNGSAKYAIETNAGWFERNNVNEGDLFKFLPN